MKLKTLLYSVAFMALLAPAPAFADWTAQFVPPADATAPMRIDLPDDLDIMTLTTLGVELDGIDITALLSLDGADFVYRPLQPLSAGEHVIRLVTLGDGVQDKGRWTFTVGGEDGAAVAQTTDPAQAQMAAENWLRGGSVDIDTLTEFSNRTFDDNLGNDAANHSIISGAGDLNAAQQMDNWDVQADANYLAMSDHTLALTGNTVDIGEYQLNADYADADLAGGVTLGHHDIGVESNLFSGFYRRGASARLGSADERVSGTAFAFRPESVSGARDFTGLNYNEDRLEGMTASFKPFSTDIDALQVIGIYYDGRGDDGGVGAAITDTSSTGSGYGAIIEKSFRQERIKLRGEYAHALYDQAGSAGTAPEDAGDAISLSAEARPFDSVIFMERSADIIVGARYDRIDTFFESLANEGLASDRNALMAYGNLYWGALSGGLQITHETNNVDDLASAPEDRLRNISINASYAFNPQQGNLAWLGSPYLNFSGFVADLDRMDTPAGYTGFDTNSVSDSITFGGGSSYDDWYWSAAHTLSEYEDHANASNDTVNNFTTLGAGWTVNDRLNINGATSFGAFRDEDDATSNYDTNINLGAQAAIIPGRLDLNFDYNLNLSTGSGDTPDRHIVNSEAEYTLIQPGRNSPGLALAVRGSMEDENGNATSTQDETEYQVYTVLRVKAPFSFGY